MSDDGSGGDSAALPHPSRAGTASPPDDRGPALYSIPALPLVLSLSLARAQVTASRTEPLGWLTESLVALLTAHPWIAMAQTVLLIVLALAWVRSARDSGTAGAGRKEQDSLFRNNLDAIVVLDAHGAIDGTNTAFSALSSRTEDELIGRSFADLVRPSDRGLVLSTLRRTLQEGIGRTVPATLRRPDGRERRLELTTVPVVDRGRVTGAYLVLRDISEQKALERRLENKALHDPLTGLPNRALFTDRIQHAMARVRRRGGIAALLYLDLDGFKEVNDTAGHQVGDELLCEVAARLSCFLREGDTVARLGGDEFAILLEGVEGVEKAVSAADRVQELFEAPIRVEGKEYDVGASIGIAVSTPETEEAEGLLRQADLAMYEAKRSGGRRYQIFDRRMSAPAFQSEAHLVGELRQALDQGDLVLHYQPIVDLAGTRIVGVEGLVRWQHERQGLLSPGVFLQAAADSGLIVPLDRFVMETACQEVRAWAEGGLIDEAFFLSLNLAGRHLDALDVVDAVSHIIDAERFPAARLQLELAETDAVAHLRRIRELKELGLRIALDDFGTGYTSLAYLTDVDIDVLKIDRSLVTPLPGDLTSLATVRTILTLADVLGMEVIVEGVEDPTQLRRLQDIGGRLVQGFCFGEPVPAPKIQELIRSGLPTDWATGEGEERREERDVATPDLLAYGPAPDEGAVT